jgi:hypothetical protein
VDAVRTALGGKRSVHVVAIGWPEVWWRTHPCAAAVVTEPASWTTGLRPS